MLEEEALSDAGGILLPRGCVKADAEQLAGLARQLAGRGEGGNAGAHFRLNGSASTLLRAQRAGCGCSWRKTKVGSPATGRLVADGGGRSNHVAPARMSGIWWFDFALPQRPRDPGPGCFADARRCARQRAPAICGSYRRGQPGRRSLCTGVIANIRQESVGFGLRRRNLQPAWPTRVVADGPKPRATRNGHERERDAKAGRDLSGGP